MHIELGKITKATFGFGGYQDVMVVFRLDIGGRGWGSCKEFSGGWGNVSEAELSKPNSVYKWTHETRINAIGKAAWEVLELMKKAKVNSLCDLVGIPVKAYFESPVGRLVTIEILEELL